MGYKLQTIKLAVFFPCVTQKVVDQKKSKLKCVTQMDVHRYRINWRTVFKLAGFSFNG